MPVSAGTRLGPYEVVELLGAGGMGEVYRARDSRLGRDVALKVLHDDVARDPDRLKRFELEARAVASLNHPHILTVHDVGSDDGTPYVVSELLEGESLREVLSRRSPTQRQVLAWAVQTAQGLAAAHRKGIVHRDLKPENLFLTTDGRIKILDFGLAKQTAASLDSAELTESSPTRPGVVMGTVAYMSPEQVQARPVDARSDLFSFGVVLYELLGRKHPFRRETVAATVGSILQETPPPLVSLDPTIPRAVDGIVRRCLEKSREERSQGAHDLGLALEAVLAAPAGSVVLEDVEERSPYPGLASFTEKDAAVFFGRETEVKAFWERIRTRKLLAVIGPSGVGKTSFLRAGILASRPEGWVVAHATPGANPALGLARALTPELAGDAEAMADLLSGVSELTQAGEPERVVSAVKRWRSRHAEALLVLDQFEELFTLNPPETQARTASLLQRVVSEADVHVALSMRDDFLIRCSDHEPLAAVFESLTPVNALARDGLRRAVVEPARKRGYRFEDQALVDEMVTTVEGVRGALPLLAFAVARLWDRRDRERKLLTREAYREIAGVEGALAQHAEATMDRIGPERQGLVREVFRNLVTAQGTRAVIDREELLSAFPDRPAAEDVLRELVDARLLTTYEIEGKDGEPSHHRVEVVHESLLKAWPRLVRWQAQDEDGALLRDQLKQAAHLWDEKGHGRSPGLRPPRACPAPRRPALCCDRVRGRDLQRGVPRRLDLVHGGARRCPPLNSSTSCALTAATGGDPSHLEDFADVDPRVGATRGPIVALVGTEGAIRVGLLSGGPPHFLLGHAGQVDGLAISPDLKWLASTGEDNTLRLWPMPDLSKPPLHKLPHGELVAKLKSLTNLRAVRDPKAANGWTIEIDPLPGWRDVPTW
jgi:eukaryotic-like serine/threonine-protein kinase